MRKITGSTFIALAAAIVASFVFVSSAGAQDNGAYVGDEVTSTVATVPTTDPDVLPSTEQKAGVSPSTETKADKLAFTGGDSAALALVGAVAVIAGGSLLIIRRRSLN